MDSRHAHISEINQSHEPTPSHIAIDIDRRLQHLLDKAPSDASSQFIVRKTRSGYKGILRITSLQHKFVSGHINRQFNKLIDQLFNDIRGQIEEWKSKRFSESK